MAGWKTNATWSAPAVRPYGGATLSGVQRLYDAMGVELPYRVDTIGPRVAVSARTESIVLGAEPAPVLSGGPRPGRRGQCQ